MRESNGQEAPLATGIAGLDEILAGGLEAGRFFLVEGDPGAGKTTLALQFLLAGAAREERCLLVALSETRAELNAVAASHGWTLAGIDIHEVSVSPESLNADARYTMYHPAEVELGETMDAVLSQVEKTRPQRLVFDSLSELRLMAENALRYRRQILRLKHFLAGRSCTVLVLDDRLGEQSDAHLHSVAHGVIRLERRTPEYGAARRRLDIVKMRARRVAQGFHDFVVRTGGLDVFPRLVATDHGASGPVGILSSGLKTLDALLGGGLDRGTSALILGAAGCGKSAIASLYATSAASRGERACVFLFDEGASTWRQRCAALGMDIDKPLRTGTLRLEQVDPAERSPGEFAAMVRAAVEAGARVVVIDSLAGYLYAMPSERFLLLHLHELTTYLNQNGVVSLLVLAQHGLLGEDAPGAIDASYLADTVLLLRYFEAMGEVRKAVSVIKKRTGPHERTIRELTLSDRVVVGPVITQFQGVLTGTPQLLDPGRLPPGAR